MFRKGIVAALLVGLLAVTGCSSKPAAQPAPAPAAPSTTPASAPAQPQANLKPVEIRIGFPVSASSVMGKGAVAFKDEVEKATNGRITVKLYPDGQLGKETAVQESLQLGTLEMALLSSTVPSLNPKLNVFDLPYLFKDRAAVAKVANGPIGADLLKGLEAQKVVGLAFMENGFRHITNNKKPIVKPEDLKGMKIRVPESKTRTLTFQTYGANPVPLNFNELFSALQQGVVDAQENPLSTIETSKFNEVQKYLSLSNHVYSASYLLASKAWFDKLDPADQKLLKETAMKVGDANRALGEQADKDSAAKLKAAGMQVNDVDFAAFQAASKPVYDAMAKDLGADFIAQVQAAAK